MLLENYQFSGLRVDGALTSFSGRVSMASSNIFRVRATPKSSLVCNKRYDMTSSRRSTNKAISTGPWAKTIKALAIPVQCRRKTCPTSLRVEQH